MIRKYFFTSALLGLALVLVASDVAQAQSLRERRMERRSMRRGTAVYSDTTTMPSAATTMRTSYYYTPEIVQGDKTGHLQVRVPSAEAKVYFDGVLTTQSGTERSYVTPALTPNNNTGYRIRVTWMQDGREMSQEQIVPVMPGRTLVVNFPRP